MRAAPCVLATSPATAQSFLKKSKQLSASRSCSDYDLRLPSSLPFRPSPNRLRGERHGRCLLLSALPHDEPSRSPPSSSFLSRSPSFRQRFAASLAALALLVTPPALAASSSDAVTALAEQLAASARFLSEQLEGQVASLSAAALGSLLGGSVAWQLATLQARRRAEDVARSKTREALNNLDPEALTSVLGELPSWLAYRDFERAGERPLRGGTCHA